jgi:hypothetical protein
MKYIILRMNQYSWLIKDDFEQRDWRYNGSFAGSGFQGVNVSPFSIGGEFGAY